MTTESSQATVDGPAAPKGRCFAIRAVAHRWGVRPTRFWTDAQRLGRTLEEDIFPQARETGQPSLTFRVAAHGVLQCARGGRPHEVTDLPAVVELLSVIGADRLTVDPRLESNQIVDVLVLLHALRRRIARHADDANACSLRSTGGLAVACTRTRFIDGEVTIDYSYCQTRFSRIVQWFESGKRRFGDHRALFTAAPRYALLAAVLAILPTVVCALWGSWPLMLVMSVISGALLFALVYLFFMTVGSVEYDKEEKAHRLDLALSRLQRQTAYVRLDLQRARTVQQQLIPSPSDLPCGRLQWAGSYVPADEIGGDYFDAAELPDGRVAILFCDVSGHGMSAAFVTALMKTAFQDWADHGISLEQFVRRLNGQLGRFTPVESFAAAMVATYRCATGELTYVNCGHSPGLWHLCAGGETVERTDGRSMILGVQEDLSIQPGHLALSAGDCVLMATDGLVEAVGPDGRMYGIDRLAELLTNRNGSDVDGIVTAVKTDVRDFTGVIDQADDQTLLAFQVRQGD